MKQRGLLAALAFVLAIVGAALVLLHVRGADARAMAGQQPTSVLVVVADVPAGTPGASLSAHVETRQLPAVAIVPGAVERLDQVPQDAVSSTTLRAGEQVLASRFVPRGSAEVAAPVPVPDGLQLLSVQLSPERVAGSRLVAGDKVGVFVSVTLRSDGSAQEVSMTDLVASDVLVARVQGAAAQGDGAAASEGEKLPGSDVVVTLAVDSPLAERIVFAKEFGSVWLSQQTPTTDTSGSHPITAGNVLG